MNRAERRTLRSRLRRGLDAVLDEMRRGGFGVPIAIGHLPDARMDDPDAYLTLVSEWTNRAMGNHPASDLVVFAYELETVVPESSLGGFALELSYRASVIATFVAQGNQDRADKITAIGGQSTIPLVVVGARATRFGRLDVYPLARGGTA